VFRTYRDDKGIKNGNNHIAQLPVSAEEEVRIFEVIGCQSETKQGDETISSNGGHSSSRNEREKRYLTWEDGA